MRKFAFFALILALSLSASAVVYVDSCVAARWNDGFFDHYESYYNFTSGETYVLTADLYADHNEGHAPLYSSNFTSHNGYATEACIYFRDDYDDPAENVTFDCDGHSISMFTNIATPEFAGILVPFNGTSGGNITIKNCVFDGFVYNSRAVELNAPNVRIENCTFADNSWGITNRRDRAMIPPPSSTENAEIVDSVFYNSMNYSAYGIALANLSKAHVSGSTFENLSCGVQLGPYTDASGIFHDSQDPVGAMVESSVFSGGMFGVRCTNCASNPAPAPEDETLVVKSNEFDGQKVTAIQFFNVTGSWTANISNNTIMRSRSAGINLANSSGANVFENAVAYCGLDAFGTKDYDNSFKRNVFYLNRGSGFVHFQVPGSSNKIIDGDAIQDIPLEYKVTQPMKDLDAFDASAVSATEVNSRLEMNQETDLLVKNSTNCTLSVLREVDQSNEKTAEHLTVECPANNSIYFVKPANRFSGFISMPFAIWFNDGLGPAPFEDRNFVAGQYAFFVESPSIYAGTILEGTRAFKPNSNYREAVESYYLDDENKHMDGEALFIGFKGNFDASAEAFSQTDFAGAVLDEYPQSITSVVKNVSFGLWHNLQQTPAFVGFQRFFTADREYDFNCSAAANFWGYNFTYCFGDSSTWTGTWTSDYVDTPKFMGIKASYNSSGLDPNDKITAIKETNLGFPNTTQVNVSYQFLDTPFLRHLSFNGESMDENIGRLQLLAATSYKSDVIDSRLFYFTRPDLGSEYVLVNLTQPFEYSYNLSHSSYSFPLATDSRLGPMAFNPNYAETDQFSSANAWATENCIDYTGAVPPTWPSCFYNKSNSSEGMTYTVLVRAGSVHKLNFKGSPVIGMVSANATAMAPHGYDVNASWNLTDSIYFMQNGSLTLWSPSGIILDQEDLSGRTFNSRSANGSRVFAKELFNSTGLYRIILWANDSRGYDASEVKYVSVPANEGCTARFEISAPESLAFTGKSGSFSVTVSNTGTCAKKVKLTESHSLGLEVLMDKDEFELRGGESATTSISLSADSFSAYSITFRLSGASADSATTRASFREKRIEPEPGGREIVPAEEKKEGGSSEKEESTASPKPTFVPQTESRSRASIPTPTPQSREILMEKGPLDVVSSALQSLINALTLKGICDNGIGACRLVAAITSAFCGGLVYFSLKHELERRKGKGLKKRITWLTEKNSWYLVGLAALFPLLPSVLIGCCEVSGYFFLDAMVSMGLAIFLFLPGEEMF